MVEIAVVFTYEVVFGGVPKTAGVAMVGVDAKCCCCTEDRLVSAGRRAATRRD